MITKPLTFIAAKARVSNRGVPPDSFLATLVTWGRSATQDIFTPNSNSNDVYSALKPVLGPWNGLIHRRAVMLEVMRVHSGLESSWNWNEGVDVTNKSSMANIEGQEAGIFQVSFDSLRLDKSGTLMEVCHRHYGAAIDPIRTFILTMKSNHSFALEYYARLVRISIQWAGPLKRNEVNPWLSRSAVTEFENLLA